jgi:hypothetical protein
MMFKKIYRWMFGGPAAEDDNQHVYRQAGRVTEEEAMSYEPGWWQRTGVWIAKVLFWVALATLVIAAVVVGISHGCSMSAKEQEKLDVEKQATIDKTKSEQDALAAKAEKDRAEARQMKAKEPCVDSVRIVKEDKNGNASVACSHKSHLMSTSWEGGKFIVLCKCIDDTEAEPEKTETNE